MTGCTLRRVVTLALMTLLLVMQNSAVLCWAGSSMHSTSDSRQSEDTDLKLKRIQQGLDLTHVSRDTLQAALTSEKVGGTDYLTVTGDVVTGVQVAKKVHDGKYVDAVRKAGTWSSKKALSMIGLSGIATVWTATELAADGMLYLVGKLDAKIIDGIVAAYIIRRSKGQGDEEAWSDTRDYPPNLLHGWPVANGPFTSDKERQRAQQDLDMRIHEQCRAAWQIYTAHAMVEGDRTRCRDTILSLVRKYEKADRGHFDRPASKGRLKEAAQKLTKPLMIPVAHAKEAHSVVNPKGRMPLFRGMNVAQVRSVLGKPSKVVKFQGVDELWYYNSLLPGYETEVRFYLDTRTVWYVRMDFQGDAKSPLARMACELLPKEALAPPLASRRLGYDQKKNLLYTQVNAGDRFFRVDVSHPARRVWAAGTKMPVVAVDWTKCKVMRYEESGQALFADWLGSPISAP